MNHPKHFYGWMTANHINSPGLMGKLARDMKSDSANFTRGWSRHRNEAYLDAVDADPGIRKAFDEAWEQYERYKAGFRNA